MYNNARIAIPQFLFIVHQLKSVHNLYSTKGTQKHKYVINIYIIYRITYLD